MPVRIENLKGLAAPPLPALPARADPIVRRIARSWRRLTNPRSAARLPDSSRRTLVAVSGGADSTALLLALAAAAHDHIAIAHVLHDLRPPPHPEADRDAVAALAARLGIPFHERAIAIDRAHNLEAGARAARYAALADIAREAGCPFVATAHHADDQLESIVMALVRGAGPDGLRAIAPRRRLPGGTGLQTGDPASPGGSALPSRHLPALPGGTSLQTGAPSTSPGGTALPSRDHAAPITLIRPCLDITRADAEALCQCCNVPWRHDDTNLDTTRLRAALRHGPLADLALLRPFAARHASRSARLLRDAAGLVHDRARGVFADATTWPRETLRRERPIVLGAGLRAVALRLMNDGVSADSGADALNAALLDPAIRAICDDSTEPRSFDWPGGLTLEITAHDVSISADTNEGEQL